MGCNLIFIVMEKYFEEFEYIFCMIVLQLFFVVLFIECVLFDQGVENVVEWFNECYSYYCSFCYMDFNVIVCVDKVIVLMMVVQVKDDMIMKLFDVQGIYDKLFNLDKKLFWIEGIIVCYEGYCYFSKNFVEMVVWYDVYF